MGLSLGHLWDGVRTWPNAHVWSSGARAGLFHTSLLMPLDQVQDPLPPAQPQRLLPHGPEVTVPQLAFRV